MATVELIYDLDCPNIGAARQALLAAFANAGMRPRWVEWDRADRKSPDYALRYGSPTVLVNGEDVTVMPPSEAACCRVYRTEDGTDAQRLSGVPPVGPITQVLMAKSTATSRSLGFLSILPTIGTALLPKLTCPLCWPAYAAALAALGVNFANYTPYLMPIVATLLLVNIAVLAWQAKANGQWGRPLIGLAGAALVWLGKFGMTSDLLVYLGTGTLILAALIPWRPHKTTPPCSGKSKSPCGCKFSS